MIQFQKVTLSRGQQTLLEEVDATIFAKSKVGLVGSNGSGKSSLFGAIKGEYELEGGKLLMPSKIRVSHVAQEVPSSEQSALEFVLDGHEPYRELETKFKNAENEGRYEEVAYLYPAWEALGGDTIPVQARRILRGLGFEDDQVELPINHFSGGWRVRLQLAKTLIHPGDLLLLDEPTNHLDLEAIIWLEKWCKSYDGTLVIIAHDIAFLDNIVDQIIHIENKKLKMYGGNYSTFTKTRAEKMALDLAMYEKQQKQKAHLQKFINRFKAKASKAKQAQSRVKQLNKIEDIALVHVASPIQFEFEEVEAPDPMIRIREGQIGYDFPLLKNISFYLGSQERIAILGKNGQGKSTFVKVLAKKLELLSGEIHFANKLKIGYFAQHQLEALDLQKTPLAITKEKYPRMSEQEVRTYLGKFHFKQDKVFVPIGELSGGERARLTFALLVLEKPQVILLDEPTNHLDIEMREALSLALQAFNGALVVVSHDRTFIDSCCDNLYLVHDGRVESYEGSLEDYAQWTLQTKLEKKETQKPKKEVKPQEDKRKLLNLVKKLESDLKKMSDALEHLDHQLADTSLYESSRESELKKLLKERDEKKTTLETLEHQWLEAQSSLESES